MPRSLQAGDTVERQHVDRIKAIAWREARDEGCQFITRKWVADRLKRSEDWVKKWWNEDAYDVHNKGSVPRPRTEISDETKTLIHGFAGRRRAGIVALAAHVAEHRRSISRETARRYLHELNFKPWHVIAKPAKTTVQRENRLTFAELLRDWEADHFLHLAPSDEFFLWSIRKPNYQNDWVWAETSDEIAETERYQEVVQHPQCIGLFILFTAKRMLWLIKEEGQSWSGDYFRQNILQDNVIPFLTLEENVLSIGETILLHDKAPGFAANATQQLLRQSPIQFFDKTEWPGNSPDLNPAECIGAILKDKVDQLMRSEPPENRNKKATLRHHMEMVLHSMEYDTALFEKLLLSFRARLDAVVAADGGHTDF